MLRLLAAMRETKGRSNSDTFAYRRNSARDALVLEATKWLLYGIGAI